MKIRITSGEYEIIDSGIVIAAEEDKDVTFHVEAGIAFSFSLQLTFKNNDSGEQTIERNITGNQIKFDCYNFFNAGTGTSELIELATYQGQKMYIKFWSYLDGDLPKKKKTRKIEYTFYLGK